MKKYPEDFRYYIARLIRTCMTITGHEQYTPKVVWEMKSDPSSTNKSQVQASIRMDTVYLWFTIYIYPELYEEYKRKDYRDIAESILHELCHLYIEPIYILFEWDIPTSHKKYYRDTVERQVQKLTLSFMNACNDSWYLPDKSKKGLPNVRGI